MIRPDDPLSAHASCEWTHVRTRGPWRVRVHSRCEMHATERAFYLRAQLAGYEDDEAVRERSWEHVIPRDHL